jgi:putative ABC transport system permease protein
MKLLRRMSGAVRALLSRRRMESELDDEVRLHLDLETAANEGRGMSTDEARRAALVTFGGVDQAKEGCRDSRGDRFLEVLAQDVRYGLRGLRRSPGFTAAVVLTLGLGIGANTAVFSLVSGVLLKPLPYARGEQVVVLRQPDARSGAQDIGLSPLEVRDFREMSRSFDDLVEFHSMDFTLLGGGEARRVRAGVVSASFFDMLQVKPVLGRTFRATDETATADAVLVLSHEYWRSLGSDPAIIGRRFDMNDRVHTVIGVLPPIPQYPQDNDVYMPSTACPFRNRPATLENRRGRMLGALARVSSTSTVAQAQADVESVSQRLRAAYPDAYPSDGDVHAALTPLKEDLVRRARPTFLMLLATVALVLLIACANVANLTLARLVERNRELAIRSALGAGRARLMRQLLTESTIVALAGGALGLLFAYLTRDLLTAFAARLTPRATEVQIDGPVLAFTLITSVLTGVLAGTLPGLPGRERIASALTGDGGRTTGDRRRQRVRSGLVAWQLALSFVLLIGAALMLRSFENLRRVDAGFQAENVVTATVSLNFSKYTTEQHALDVERIGAFYRQIEDRLRAVPGVVALANAWTFPLNNTFQNDGTFRIEGRDPGVAPAKATFIAVSPEYFSTIGVPVMRGRVFDERDRADADPAVLVNQRLARQYWGEEDPVGRRLSGDGGKTWRTIAGVVGDVRQGGLDQEPGPAVYLPFRAFPGFASSLFVRVLGDPARAGEELRQAVRTIDPETPVTEIRTLDDIRGEALSSPRLTTMLLSLFAVLALVITAAGLSGLIAYSVSQRTQEIGIRMALGANRGRITAMILREGMTSVAFGLALGIVGALALSRLVSGLLFGVGPTDVYCYAGSALVLIVAAAAACFLPARRATAVSPLKALRAQA